jgi:Na+/melibiose symporter-like transporter
VPGEKSKIDIVGTTMLMSGIVLVLLYLTEAPTLGWLSLENIALLIPGLALTIGFFAFENKQTSPLIQLKLLKIRNVLVANLVGILSSMAMFLLFFGVIYYAQYPSNVGPYGLGLSVINTGLTLAPATLVMLIVGPLIGRLVTKIGPKPILAMGASIGIIGLLLFIFSRATTLELTIDVAVYSYCKHDFRFSAQGKHGSGVRNEHHAKKPRRSHWTSSCHNNNFNLL